MGVVAFDWLLWSARYPELAAFVPQATAQSYFNEAQLYCDNTPCSPIRDDTPGGQRATLLNMLTAHIAALNAPLNGQPSSPLVGRINGATEGSVSVQTQYIDPKTDLQAWANSTKYGAAWWAATVQFRSFRYVPGPVRQFDRPLGVGRGTFTWR
jgi:Protein of unknown function (DUF4054)